MGVLRLVTCCGWPCHQAPLTKCLQPTKPRMHPLPLGIAPAALRLKHSVRPQIPIAAIFRQTWHRA